MPKKKAVDLSIVPPTVAYCDRHGAKSHDFVSLNTKKEPVFRCAAGHMGPVSSNPAPFGWGAHYFTVEREPVSA